jgi:DNA-binding NarL/FixJ family response regulator
MKVVIVEDHPLVRTGLRTSLQSIGFDVVGEAEDGVAAIALVRALLPDLAVVDLGLPGRSGLAVVRELKAEASPPRIVVLTMREGEADVLEAVASGVDGYCVKSSGGDVVMDAVRTVAAGGAYFDPKIAHVVLGRLTVAPLRDESAGLTARELAVLRMIADGKGNAEIARTLAVPLGTVKADISDLMRKLGAADRANAAVIALRHGYL